MFGLGFGELIIILIVALLVFGPDKLPEVARTLGRAMAELRRTMDDVRYEFNSARLDMTSTASEAVRNESVKSDVTTVLGTSRPAQLNTAQLDPASIEAEANNTKENDSVLGEQPQATQPPAAPSETSATPQAPGEETPDGANRT